DLAARDAEGELQRQRAVRRPRIVPHHAVLGQHQQAGTDAVLDPAALQLAVHLEAHDVSVEFAHGVHVAGEQDRAIEMADVMEGIHRSLLECSCGTDALDRRGCGDGGYRAAQHRPSCDLHGFGPSLMGWWTRPISNAIMLGRRTKLLLVSAL